jgi:hypothetical protein
MLGYFCAVKPKGYVVLSVRKELAPVKAYSDTSDLAPDSDQGMADYIKGGMERILDTIEQQIGPVSSAKAEHLEQILEINYRRAWEELNHPTARFREGLNSGPLPMDYQGGDVLLTSEWHQDAPYNLMCPEKKGCDHAKVGCIATAGAQIMRYWNWPPYGEGSPYNQANYDWVKMPGKTSFKKDLYVDENGNPLSQAQLDAVARLNKEVGWAAGMDYGCSESTALLGNNIGNDMLDGYEDHFRYNGDAQMELRSSHMADGWWDIIKSNLDGNRPLQYAIQTSWLIGGHSMVCDGWQIVGNTRQYHMNYGWGDSRTTWYSLDELYGSKTYITEMVIRRLYPGPSVKESLSGTYVKNSFPYRYFDQDTAGSSATFDAGQLLQFLPGVKVGSHGTIKFLGAGDNVTEMFSIKYPTKKSIKIYNGHIYLYSGGSLTFPK